MEQKLPNPVFSCNREKLSLIEIIQDRKVITSLTISYYSKAEKINVRGLLGIFGVKKISHQKRIFKVVDDDGISLVFNPYTRELIIRFTNSDCLKQVVNNDENTLILRRIQSYFRPIQASFLLKDLKAVEWES